ncbi:hypothetical protein ACSQ67_019934 [Phaseolus vulgaris]
MRGSSSMASTKTNLFPPNSWIATPNLDSWTYREAFYYTQNPDIVLYRAILRNVYQFGEYDNTLILYKAMVGKSPYPDEESCSFVLRSCYCLSHELGKMVHGRIVRLGLDAFHLVGRTLVELYDMNGIFNVDEPVEGKYVMELNYWNTLISKASENGKMEESFKLFCRMRKENIQPNSITVIGLLRSIVELNLLKTGQALHSFVVVSCSCGELTVNTCIVVNVCKVG